jgi:hypothetical protein
VIIGEYSPGRSQGEYSPIITEPEVPNIQQMNSGVSAQLPEGLSVHGRFFSAKCEIFRLFLLNCEQSRQAEIIRSSSRNSKETGEIFRISPRKSVRGIRP